MLNGYVIRKTMNNSILNYVSRETIPFFETFISLLKQWNRKTSLVQIDTLEHVWERHILDSLQLLPLLGDKNSKILDIGTGGGFPGLVLAIAGFKGVDLCESNIRKTVFLDEVIRTLELPTEALNTRAENINKKYDFVTSRACAELNVLLGYMKNVSHETGTVGIFLKGRTVKDEVQLAQKSWDFSYELFPSITAKDSKIIVVRNLKVKGDK